LGGAWPSWRRILITTTLRYSARLRVAAWWRIGTGGRVDLVNVPMFSWPARLAWRKQR
jgi:hypothetical protein